ncbi:MAG: tyrosine-protein phosphatase [Bacteroidales bacterium]|nr:tyrosine-protein phosphatase [Bacteroidales bacterium]
MKLRYIAFLLLIQLSCCCSGKIEGYIIPPPSNKPSSGQQGGGSDSGGEVTPPPATQPKNGFIVLGYATYWDSVMPDPTYLTHINYSFAHIKSDFQSLDIKNETRLAQIAALKNKNPNLVIMLSVGGWGAGNFSEMAANETYRKKFCQNCLNAINRFRLDGIDLDWEYPTQTAGGKISASKDDTKNFTLLLKDLRSVLGSDKLITMASSSSADYIDWATAEPYLDWVNVMSYDMGKPPYHNAALYVSSMTDGKAYHSCDGSVRKHHDKGVPYDKIVMGIPFFGRVEGGDEVYFRKIDYKDYVKHWDNTAQVPYLTDASGKMVLTYDDAESVALKAQYVIDKDLRGAMYWNIEADDANHTLGKAVAATLLGWTDSNQQTEAFLATNQYVQKYLEEVDYTSIIQQYPYGDSDNYGKYTQVTKYSGGGPSENNIEIPPTYTIKWTASSSSQKLKVWEGGWSREYSIPGGTGMQDITNLVPNTTYQWKVTKTSDNTEIASGKFATRGLLHQVYFAPNVRNGRDLGGYKGYGGKTVVYRKLYRGGLISKKYCNSDGVKEMLAEGIKAEVDLQEESSASSSSPLGSNIDFYAPHFDSGYNTMIRDNPEKVKNTFCWVVARLRENKPVYFHCWAGRDRTATLAILLEGALGVSENDMAKDYELTYFTPADWGMSESGTVYKHYWDNYSYTSVRKTIFKETDSGTYQERIVKYLLKIGVPQQDIDDLRSKMLK